MNKTFLDEYPECNSHLPLAKPTSRVSSCFCATKRIFNAYIWDYELRFRMRIGKALFYALYITFNLNIVIPVKPFWDSYRPVYVINIYFYLVNIFC